MKSRFARFANVPEMLRMLHVAADVKTADDLDLPVPALGSAPTGSRAPETVTVEPSDELLDYVRDLGDRAAQVRNRAVGPDEDNMLKISGDGRRAALDLRLVGLPQTTPGKIAAAADRIAAIWQAHRDDEYFAPDGIPYPVRGSLQLVFCDLGTPGPGWNAYDELRDQLTARGLPARGDPVHPRGQDRPGQGPAVRRLPHRRASPSWSAPPRRWASAPTCKTGPSPCTTSTPPGGPPTSPSAKAASSARATSTPKSRSSGTSPQQSFDGYMWQTLERKARFIHQVMHGRLDTREIADIGDTALSFSEVKALATGNPLLMDKAEADAALARLQRAERAHQRNQDALRHAITDYEAEITRLTALAAAIDTAIAQRQDTRGEKFTMTVGGTQHSKRADAGQHAKDILAREAAALTGQLRRAATIGRLAGFAVNAELSRALGATNVTITLDGAPGTTIEIPASGLPRRRPCPPGHPPGTPACPARDAQGRCAGRHRPRPPPDRPRPRQHRRAVPARRGTRRRQPASPGNRRGTRPHGAAATGSCRASRPGDRQRRQPSARRSPAGRGGSGYGTPGDPPIRARRRRAARARCQATGRGPGRQQWPRAG